MCVLYGIVARSIFNLKNNRLQSFCSAIKKTNNSVLLDCFLSNVSRVLLMSSIIMLKQDHLFCLYNYFNLISIFSLYDKIWESYNDNLSLRRHLLLLSLRRRQFLKILLRFESEHFENKLYVYLLVQTERHMLSISMYTGEIYY